MLNLNMHNYFNFLCISCRLYIILWREPNQGNSAYKFSAENSIWIFEMNGLTLHRSTTQVAVKLTADIFRWWYFYTLT